jgi:hypothetical protein
VLDTFAAKAAPHLQTLANAPTEDGNGGLSRIVFAWFGTSADRLDPVCRDGLRALRVRDDGFFGRCVLGDGGRLRAPLRSSRGRNERRAAARNAHPVRVLHFADIPCHAGGGLQVPRRGGTGKTSERAASMMGKEAGPLKLSSTRTSCRSATAAIYHPWDGATQTSISQPEA